MIIEDLVIDGHLRCGFVKKDGEPCRQVAGKGTDHLGIGRCKFHGGNSKIKHGRYSKVQGGLGDKIQEHMDSPSPLDLLPELATLRALFERWIDQDGERSPVEILAGAEKLVDGMRKTVDTIHKMQTRELLTSREMEMGLYRILEIITEEVSDPESIARISQRFNSAFQIHAENVSRAIGQIEGD